MASTIINEQERPAAAPVQMGELAYEATLEMEVLYDQALRFDVDINDDESLITFMTLARSVIRRAKELNGMLMEVLTTPETGLVRKADEHWQRMARGVSQRVPTGGMQ